MGHKEKRYADQSYRFIVSAAVGRGCDLQPVPRKGPIVDASAGSSEPRTSVTLLLRLRDLSDREAWNDFVARYTPRIFNWCRRYHLQETDAADVTQDVLGKLVTAFRQQQFDPAKGSFRAWLKTVVNNTVKDLFREWSHQVRIAQDSEEDSPLLQIQAPEAQAGLAAELEAEAHRELLREAEHRVQLRVKPATWQAYYETAVAQRPVADVAAEVQLPIAEVYVAKSRVIKMLREEIEKLEGT